MNPEQLLQQLIDGQMTAKEFKRLARRPAAMASPSMMSKAFRVPVTLEGRHMDTGETMAEWLPRLKKERGLLRVVQFEVTWEEWQEALNDDSDAWEYMNAAAKDMGITMPELNERIQKWEDEISILY